MLAYEWAIDHCPESDFVLKVDDDTFVDTIHLPVFLKRNHMGEKTKVVSYANALSVRN